MGFNCMTKAIVLFFLVATITAGCSGMQSRERVGALNKVLQDYAAALRWARYSDAYDHIRAPDGSKPGLDLDRFEGYRVTGMDIIRSDLNLEETRATTYVTINYYRDTSGTIREKKEVQDWWYDEDAKRWFLDGDLPYPDKG